MTDKHVENRKAMVYPNEYLPELPRSSLNTTFPVKPFSSEFIMNMDAYVQHIDNIIYRLDNTFPNIENDPSEWELRSIRKQLEFILFYAKSGESFKQGLLKKTREIIKSWFDAYPAKDVDLFNAITIIHNDLDSHDYNAGTINRSISKQCLDLIDEKYSYYENLKKIDNSKNNDACNSLQLIQFFSNYLVWANYVECWVMNGIKNIQYFSLIDIFSYLGLTVRAIDERLPSGEGTLSDDIERIHNFYTSLESEGTHMWLNPVELKEDGDQVYLVDLRGNIIEKGDNVIEL